MRKNAANKEPRVRLVLSPQGLERVEVWARGNCDREEAMRLYFGLTPWLQTCPVVRCEK